MPDVPAVRGLTPATSRGSDPTCRPRRRESSPIRDRSPNRCRPSRAAPRSARWPRRSPAHSRHGGVLLVEAGTGTGKTLAYLVPAILSGQRVLVSTGTKNLQEQIYFKDLAVLREALDVPFTATYMKGRGNYLCLHRFESFRDRREERHARSCSANRRRRSFCRSSTNGRSRPRRAIARRSPTCRRTCPSGERLPRRRRTASAPSARATPTASSPACARAPPNRISSS